MRKIGLDSGMGKDLVVNVLAGAIVALGTYTFGVLLPTFNQNLLTFLAGIVAIVVIFAIHVSRSKSFFTAEPIVMPLVFTGLTILAILAIRLWAVPDRPPAVGDLVETPAGPVAAPVDESCLGRTAGEGDSFAVYPDYGPVGYMGDTGDIVNVAPEPDLVRFTYEAQGRGPQEWEYKYTSDGTLNPNSAKFAGVMYLCCGWGESPGYDLRPFRRAIAWEARSVSGDVTIEFVIGGADWIWDHETGRKIAPPCPDTLKRKPLGIFTVTEQWQSFEVDLTGRPEEEFVNVIGGFAWVITWGSNDVQPGGTPKTFVIEIRNVRYHE
jgi:hypothetical protein